MTFGAHTNFARIEFRIEPEIEDGQGQTEWSYVNGGVIKILKFELCINIEICTHIWSKNASKLFFFQNPSKYA